MQATIERTVEKTFNVTSGARIRIDTFTGAVAVVPSDLPQVHVAVRQRIEAEDDAHADRILRDIELQFSQDESHIQLRASYRRAMRWSWEKWPPVGLEFTISVPRSSAVEIVSREGRVTVGSLAGNVSVHSFLSTVSLGEIGGDVTVDGTPGDVAITSCGGKLLVEARGGNVMVGRSLGPAQISGSGGSFELSSARGTVRVSTDGADVKVGFAYPIASDSELSVSGGDVSVTVDTRCAAKLDARAWPFGKVRVQDLALKITEGEAGTARVAGELNGGGPAITIRCSGGRVRLEGVPSVPNVPSA